MNTSNTRKHLIQKMMREGVKVTAIAEAFSLARQRVYVIVRGYTEREKQYRRHFVFGHEFHNNCPYCLDEQQKV